MSKTIQFEIELLSGQRQSGESDKAALACNDWLRLGSGRTLSSLLEKYRDMPQNAAPTTSIHTLQAWSKTFGWAGRAVEYDASWEVRKNTEREAVLNYGLALEYERLRKLYRLASMLEAQIYERGETGVLHNLWLPDVKQIGSGDDAERVDIERFNAPLLEQYRKVLEDIAKEVGGRVLRTDVKVDDWRGELIALLKAGTLTPEQVLSELGNDLASELFISAGVSVSPG